ncbi:hypothetical protein E3N88_43673 [Mikania micrantha]|uniref:Uncharacterized protein n=1 Tax=Mikania micrantha TaxID=192012 RepID=A0A5N6LEA1_9ASTR|nr:hypothetical protein E3N88_43673 [Mikania micrantha]
MGRGEYRTNDMLSSKWRDMNLKVRKFNVIYSQKWQTRRSGQSDAMIELEAEDQYREEFNAPFSLQRTVVVCAWKMINMVWLRPKRLEKYLRNQGFNGNKYKLLFGDMKEMSLMFQQSKSKHISIHDEDAVLPHVAAFNHQSLKKYGNLHLSYNLTSFLNPLSKF